MVLLSKAHRGGTFLYLAGFSVCVCVFCRQQVANPTQSVVTDMKAEGSEKMVASLQSPWYEWDR